MGTETYVYYIATDNDSLFSLSGASLEKVYRATYTSCMHKLHAVRRSCIYYTDV